MFFFYVWNVYGFICFSLHYCCRWKWLCLWGRLGGLLFGPCSICMSRKGWIRCFIRLIIILGGCVSHRWVKFSYVIGHFIISFQGCFKLFGYLVVCYYRLVLFLYLWVFYTSIRCHFWHFCLLTDFFIVSYVIYVLIRRL
jgi:hypothetical protein